LRQCLEESARRAKSSLSALPWHVNITENRECFSQDEFELDTQVGPKIALQSN